MSCQSCIHYSVGSWCSLAKSTERCERYQQKPIPEPSQEWKNRNVYCCYCIGHCHPAWRCSEDENYPHCGTCEFHQDLLDKGYDLPEPTRKMFTFTPLQWISVNSVLPPISERCAVFIGDCSFIGWRTEPYADGESLWYFYSQTGLKTAPDVTHWMSLPELPGPFQAIYQQTATNYHEWTLCYLGEIIAYFDNRKEQCQDLARTLNEIYPNVNNKHLDTKQEITNTRTNI